MKPSFIHCGLLSGLLVLVATTYSNAATIISSGGALGTQLIAGNVDIEGDGTLDIEFVIISPNGYLDKIGAFGLTGNIGGSPGSGAAWVSSSSNTVTLDGVGRNEIIADFRGATLSSSDNWSKVHLSSGDGWVQWQIGSESTQITPLLFVLEASGEDLSAAQAAAVPEPSSALLSLLGVVAMGLHRRRSGSI